MGIENKSESCCLQTVEALFKNKMRIVTAYLMHNGSASKVLWQKA